jgi:lysozyme
MGGKRWCVVTAAQLAASLIAVFEGCKLTAYQDSGGIWTIGFGHTGPDIHLRMTITQDQANAYFEHDVAPLLVAVADKPILEAAALVSFGYNAGLSAMKKVMAGTSDMSTFIHDAHGNVLSYLQRRRALEMALIEVSKRIPMGLLV